MCATLENRPNYREIHQILTLLHFVSLFPCVVKAKIVSFEGKIKC